MVALSDRSPGNEAPTQPEVRSHSFELAASDSVRGLLAREVSDMDKRRVIAQFEQNAFAHPERAALMQGAQCFTYGEMLSRVNRLARALEVFGVGLGSRVAVRMARSPDLILTLLAVMKSGGAFVPIDMRWPTGRIATMLEDAGVTLSVVDADADVRVDGTIVSFSDLAQFQELPETRPPSAPPLGGGDLCYVMFTSGTTGRPKGVAISHQSLENCLNGMTERIGFNEDDRWLASTNFGFDPSLLEWLLPLTIGARVILVSDADAVVPSAMLDISNNAGVTIMQATPAVWRAMLSVGQLPDSLRVVLCGGEAMDARLANDLTAGQHCTVWNLYGPTEGTIWSSIQEVPQIHHLVGPSIGLPLPNVSFSIVSEEGNVDDVEGELYVGGVGLSVGYVGQPELTRERFVQWPDAANRAYRTGDRVRKNSDGNLEFIGRLDHQVKIRGNRIEPEEIEIVLCDEPEISAACVVPCDGPAGKRLVAFVVFDPGMNLSREALTARMARRLPQYMVPSSFVVAANLPLTRNGKVDRAELARSAADIKAVVNHLASPRTSTERVLVEIWSEVFSLDECGIQDNFYDRGGHSLLAVSLFLMIEERLSVRLGIAELLDNPTISALAGVVDAKINSLNT